MNSTLIGREAELGPLDELLRAATEGLHCVVLEGDSGIGKTALWEVGVSLARDRGFRVLVARCRSTETKLAFAALGDLLADSHALLEELPTPQRRALAAALLLDEHDEPVGPRAVGLAFLNCVHALAASSPLLVAIDDLQWVDPSSAATVAFALARLSSESIGVLATARTAEGGEMLALDDAVPSERVTRLALRPLSLAGTYELLRTRIGVELSRPALLRLHAASGGNPLFALEMGRLLAVNGEIPAAAADWPVPANIERAVETRVGTLDRPTQEALLVVALAAEPTIQIVDAVCGDARTRLSPAVEAQILQIEHERVRFAHPLFSAAVRSLADPAKQRAVHARLAEIVSNPEERALHAVRAGTEPRAAAAALEEAAAHAVRRGAPDSAAALFEEALQLASDDNAERARLTVAAASAYTDALDSERAASLLETALPTIPPGPFRGRALLELLRTDTTMSDRLIEEALENAGGDAHLRAEILSYAAVLHEVEKGVAAASATAAEALREAERTDDGQLIAETLAYAGHLATLADPGDAGLALLMRAQDLQARTRRISGWDAPTHWIGVRLMWEDRLDEARDLLEQQLRVADEDRDAYSQSGLCFHLTQLETRAGAAARALAFAKRAWEIDAASRRMQGRAISLYAQGLAHANFGVEATARAAAVEALAAFELLGDLFFTIHARSALAQLELSLDDSPAAIEALADVRALRERTQVGEPGIFPFDADEIEGLVGVGRVDEADALADDLVECGRTLGRARLVATGLRSRALVAAASEELDEAAHLLREALVEHERLPVPLERGRTLLALGTVLRRAQRKREARETLEQAAALFSEIDTPRWERRARAESARIGGRTAPRGRLTAMEEKIAELAAAGRTNAEIGDELHVSPRTVQWNLSKIYKKLGVRSRTELAAARLQPRA